MDEKPYFIYITFYVCLAIIKKNIYDATKDETQKSLFIKCLFYAKKHFGDIMKRGLQFPPDYPRFTPHYIPAAKYGLKGGLMSNQLGVESFGGDFLNNFINDLDSYLKRAPGLKETLLDYLSGPPRLNFGRQGPQSGGHISGVPPLPPPPSILQNLDKAQALWALVGVAALTRRYNGKICWSETIFRFHFPIRI